MNHKEQLKTMSKDWVESWVKKPKTKFKTVSNIMPDKPFRMLIVGPSGAGKTTLLTLLITKMLAYDKIYVFCRNLFQDVYEGLEAYFTHIVNQKLSKKEQKELGVEKLNLEDIYETSKEPIPLENIPLEGQKLIIFDDLISDRQLIPLFQQYFMHGRPRNCSCIFLSQSYYSTDSTVRQQMTHYVIFDLPQERNRNAICKELGLERGFLDRTITEPYDFIYFDIQKRRLKNFDENC